jgi:hypothetical protein
MAADFLTAFAPYMYALMVVMVWSMFLYKDNPFFRFAENMTIGISLGYLTVFSAKYILDMTLAPLAAGSIVALIPLVLGLLTLTRVVPTKQGWLARLPIAVIVGVGIGLSMRGELEAQLKKQLGGLMLPIIGGEYTPIDNIVKLVAAVSIVVYFVFSREHTGTWGRIARLGRYMFMVLAGVYFATVSFGRFTWFAGQVVRILTALGLVA